MISRTIMCEGKRVFGTIFPARISIWIGFCCLFCPVRPVTQTIAIIAEVTLQVKRKSLAVARLLLLKNYFLMKGPQESKFSTSCSFSTGGSCRENTAESTILSFKKSSPSSGMTAIHVYPS